jgi:putative transposase
VKYAFIEKYRQQHAVRRMCSVLQVSPSGYYDWRNRPESARSIRHRHLTMKIRQSFQESHETYGAIRVCHDLRDEGERVGKNTVAVLMHKAGLVPRPIRRFRVTTDSRNTVASPNLLNRDFSVSKANRSWVSDITAIPTREGWLYLCVFIDLYSRAVIGWSMSGRMKAELVSKALKMAVERRHPEHSVLVHSDQGSQYTSDDYQRMLKKHGMVSRMSRRGNCWDNAVAESFFHSLKTERTHHEKYRNRTHARLRVFEYIEVFYNRTRKHSSLNYMAPLVYEERVN